ncbi:MAG: hypothetical protein ACYSQZ_08910 [Planctomycetota bacterium]|jgi:hypothetical protein
MRTKKRLPQQLSQIAETVQTGDWIAADEDIKKIEQLLKQRQEKINGKQ